MSDRGAIDPLVREFDVAAGADHAFATWVRRAHLWWPRGHTVSGSPEAIVFEPHAGGRVHERGPDGTEHDWGEVVVWAPPQRIELLWHLFFPRSEATRVAVTFTPQAGGTRVRIEQTGWDELGDQGPIRRERTVQGWLVVTEAYAAFLEPETGNTEDDHHEEQRP